MKWANHNLWSDSKQRSIHTGVKVNHQCVCWLLSDFLHFPECPPSSLEELAGTFFISLWVSLWVLKPVVVNCSSFSENDRCTHQSVCNRLLYKLLERRSCCFCAVTAAEKYWELVNKHRDRASWLCSEAGCCPSLPTMDVKTKTELVLVLEAHVWFTGFIMWHSPVLTIRHRT